MDEEMTEEYNNNPNEEILQKISDEKFSEVIKKAAQSDREALVELCALVVKSVLFRISYFIDNRADAERIGQEVLLRMCSEITRFSSPKAFRLWLSSIIVNEINTHFAKISKSQPILEIDSIANTQEDKTPQSCAEEEETPTTISSILKSLPLKQKMAILLHYYDDLSITEIAKIMGITKQSVLGYIHMTHKKLKQELENTKPLSENKSH